ncbi:MAG: histidine kinase dimerization/phosphoacceptor domain-containing protein, partial [Cutibacterium granulosum]|nr:histidine kinase dimerization/phosphoacceptor domain-containing protein [Cutibacterium granulosum]
MKLVSTQQVPLPVTRERRQSVLYAAVWMVFEILAVASLLEPPAVPVWHLVLGLACIAAFTVTYLWMFYVNPDGAELWTSQRFVRRSAIGGFGVLWALVVVLELVRVGAAVSLFPFIIAYAAYALPYVVTMISWGIGVIVGLAIWWTNALPTGWLLGAGTSAAIVTVTGLLSRYRRRMQDQLRADKEMVVRLTERERIASDMHDLLGQTLTVTAMKAELVQRLIPTSPDK